MNQTNLLRGSKEVCYFQTASEGTACLSVSPDRAYHGALGKQTDSPLHSI